MYTAFAQHWGFTPLPMRPRNPKESGKQERSGGYVKDNALKGRRFNSLAEQNEHLRKWNRTIARLRIHGTTRKQVWKHYLESERPALQSPVCVGLAARLYDRLEASRMATLMALLKVVHVLNAVLMAWPYYALVAVNQRARLGPPLGDRTDTYLEGIIKNRTVPCFVFQGTALVTGLALVLAHELGLGSLVANPVLGLKLFLLLLIAALLSYVHFGLQPRIDALFAQIGTSPSPDLASRIGGLRLRRKRMASLCMFVVLTTVMLGVQVWSALDAWVTALLVLAIALFTWRSYKSTTPYGWV